jgi:hypothetical protein
VDGNVESEAVRNAVNECVLERGADTEIVCDTVALDETLALGVIDTIALKDRGERDAIAVSEGKMLLLLPGLRALRR